MEKMADSLLKELKKPVRGATERLLVDRFNLVPNYFYSQRIDVGT